MFNRRTIAIIKRELREKLFSKTFIIMTLLIPVFLFGILGFQTFLNSYGNDSNISLKIVAPTDQIIQNLKDSFSKNNMVKDGKLKISFATEDKNQFDETLTKSKKDLLGDKLTGIIFIPSSALQDKKIDYYSKTATNNSLFSKLRDPINTALLNLYFSGKQFSKADLSFAREGVDFNGYRVSKDKKVQEEGIGNTIIAMLFSFLLYFSLIFLGTMILRSVVQEKNNRIVELLLSSADSGEMMTGKILGTSITGLLQMAIWLLPLIVVISSSWFMLPKELVFSITLGQILYVLFNYFVGLITFTGLFAAVGAIFDNDQDAQSGMWPVMMLVMIPFFIAISLVNNPGNQIAVVTSMLPFASIIVMPARLSLVDIPFWQFALAIAVNVGTMLVMFPISGKIYRVGILMTGKKPQWSEVIKWLKYKY